MIRSSLIIHLIPIIQYNTYNVIYWQKLPDSLTNLEVWLESTLTLKREREGSGIKSVPKNISGEKWICKIRAPISITTDFVTSHERCRAIMRERQKYIHTHTHTPSTHCGVPANENMQILWRFQGFQTKLTTDQLHTHAHIIDPFLHSVIHLQYFFKSWSELQKCWARIHHDVMPVYLRTPYSHIRTHIST